VGKEKRWKTGSACRDPVFCLKSSASNGQNHFSYFSVLWSFRLVSWAGMMAGDKFAELVNEVGSNPNAVFKNVYFGFGNVNRDKFLP
jgi:hypothetical protein